MKNRKLIFVPVIAICAAASGCVTEQPSLLDSLGGFLGGADILTTILGILL